MKTDKSSNTHDTNRKVYHPVNHESMKVKERLQGRNPGDGREGSYKIKDEIDTEKTDDQVSSMNSDVSDSSVKANQEDVKKEFEIRSDKSEDKDIMNKKQKGSDESMKKSEEDPGFEREEREEKKSGEWRKSYKGDAELIT